MAKALKTLVKAAAGAGAAYLALGEIVYEGVINIDFNNFIRKTGWFDDKRIAEFYEKCTILHEANDWYDEQGCGDTVLMSQRIGRNTFAKTYFPDEPSNKWALLLHGYSDSPKDMAHFAMVYLSMGFNIVIPHMIGHGSDKSCYTSMGYYDRLIALDWIDYIVEKNPEAKIIVHGVSMGGATTMMVTGEDLPSNVVAAVEDCGYTSCWDEYISQVGPMLHLAPAAIPVVSAANTVSRLRGNFNFKECSPLKAVVNSKTPTLFIHGEDDDFVPFEMVKTVYEACGAPDKAMFTVPGALHAISVYVDNEGYWKAVKEFIGKYI